MGLIHTRARKKRDRAEAKLLRTRERSLRMQERERVTVGALIMVALRRRKDRRP